MLYAIGDLHLSLDGSKSMEVFGPRWKDYLHRLEEGFSRICDLRAHGRELDQHIGAVLPVLDHTLHRFQMPDGS